jgi:hypothetical protein
LDALTSVAAPALGGMAGAMLGWYLGRWQRHREYFYQKKLDAYSSLVAALLDFAANCGPAPLTVPNLKRVMDSYAAAMRTLHMAGLYMGKRLRDDLFKRTTASSDALRAAFEFLDNINKIRAGTFSLDTDFESFKEDMRVKGNWVGIPGPFKPLSDAIPEIIDMLKADLGVEKLGGSFYGRN